MLGHPFKMKGKNDYSSLLLFLNNLSNLQGTPAQAGRNFGVVILLRQRTLFLMFFAGKVQIVKKQRSR